MKKKTLSIVCMALFVALSVPSLMAQSDSLSGTWVGDWGPSPTHRNPVTVQLSWNGSVLTGVVNPGPDAIELSKAMFDAATGDLLLEAEVPYRGALAHYVMEGKLEGNTMMGSWNHDDTDGDFKLTKE